MMNETVSFIAANYSGNLIERMFYSLSEGGFWGGLVLYLLIQLIVYFVCITLTVFILANIRILPNWIYYILAYVAAFFVMRMLVGWIADMPGYYGKTLAWLWAYGSYIFMAYQIIRNFGHERCPYCHRMENAITDRLTETRSWTKVERTYSANGNQLSETRTPQSESHTQSQRVCKYCGSSWWTWD